MMRFTKTALSGLYIVELERMEDNRGFFARAWCETEFSRQGLAVKMVQANVGFNKKKGTLRGMHYQVSPHAETKLVRCTRGAIFDVALDLRQNSPTHRQSLGIELSEDNHRMFYIPEGFAHGYQTLTDNAELYYQTSHYFFGDAARGVRFDDAAFGIHWPEEIGVVSEKDRTWPDYEFSL